MNDYAKKILPKRPDKYVNWSYWRDYADAVERLFDDAVEVFGDIDCKANNEVEFSRTCMSGDKHRALLIGVQPIARKKMKKSELLEVIRRLEKIGGMQEHLSARLERCEIVDDGGAE